MLFYAVLCILFIMFAIIKTGGKQYIVTPGQKLKIEKLTGDEGSLVIFDHILLIADGDKAEIGAPMLQGASVEAKVVRQFRTKKVIVFRYHPKTRLRKKRGHRQFMTEVEIERIIFQ